MGLGIDCDDIFCAEAKDMQKMITLITLSILAQGTPSLESRNQTKPNIGQLEISPQAETPPHWASYDIVKRIYKCCKVHGVNYAQLYRHENNVPSRMGIEDLTFSIETDTVGHTHLNVRVYSDPVLMKNMLSHEDAPRDFSADITEIKKLQRALDSAVVPDILGPDFLQLHYWSPLEMKINDTWSSVNGRGPLYQGNNVVVRAGSTTSIQDNNPLERASDLSMEDRLGGGPLCERLVELKGQLKRCQKRSSDMSDKFFKTRIEDYAKKIDMAQVREIERENFAAKAEFARRYIEEYALYMKQLAEKLRN
jgi:hypothetical protein